jgi:hypothetical protein
MVHQGSSFTFGARAVFFAMLVTVGAIAGCAKQTGAIVQIDVKTLAGGAGTIHHLELFFASEPGPAENIPKIATAIGFSTGKQVVMYRDSAEEDLVDSVAVTNAGATFEYSLSADDDGLRLIVVGFDDKGEPVGIVDVGTLVVPDDRLNLYPVQLSAAPEKLRPLYLFGDTTKPSCLAWNRLATPVTGQPPVADTLFVVRQGDLNCNGMMPDTCDQGIRDLSVSVPAEVCDGFDSGADCSRFPTMPTDVHCVQSDDDGNCLVGNSYFCNDVDDDPWTCESDPNAAVCVNKGNCSDNRFPQGRGPGQAVLPPLSTAPEVVDFTCTVSREPTPICVEPRKIKIDHGDSACGSWTVIPGLALTFSAVDRLGPECVWILDDFTVPRGNIGFANLEVPTSDGHMRRSRFKFTYGIDAECDVVCGAVSGAKVNQCQ